MHFLLVKFEQRREEKNLLGYIQHSICSLPGLVPLPVSGCIFNSAVVCIPRRGLCYKNIPAWFGLYPIHPGNLQLIRVQFPLLVDPLGCTSVWIRILNVFWLHNYPPRFREIKTEKHSVSLRVSHTTKVSFFSYLQTQRSQNIVGQLPVPRDIAAVSSCEEQTRKLTGNKEGKTKKLRCPN